MKKVPPLTPTSKTFNKNNRLHLDVFPSRTGFNQPKEIPRVMLFLFAQGDARGMRQHPPADHKKRAKEVDGGTGGKEETSAFEMVSPSPLVLL